MALEKIFIIMALILGIGSSVDLAFALISSPMEMSEILRCALNIVIAVFLYLYFNKKRKAKLIVEKYQ